jgi:catechol 2,3-dioxygenase-like lactoylglutathione lyase family enzyme
MILVAHASLLLLMRIAAGQSLPTSGWRTEENGRIILGITIWSRIRFKQGGLSMDTIITDLVNRFERGGLTRRQLIQGLTALVAAGTAVPAAAQGSGLKATGIDHTSVLVTDLQRSAEFYQRVFGLTPVSEDKANRILRLGGAGGTGTGATLVSLRQENPPGLIDHFAISVDQFNRDAVTGVLKQHGITPAQNIEFGFHIKDPDGAVVQIV